MEENFKKQEKVELENKVVDKVVEDSKVDIPKGMIDTQVENEVADFEYRVRMQGLELDKYLELTGSDLEGLKDQLKPLAEKRVRADIVLEAIGKKENIEVSDEELDDELEKLADQYKQENKEKFIADMKKGDLGFLKAGITNSKVIDLLLSRVNFK